MSTPYIPEVGDIVRWAWRGSESFPREPLLVISKNEKNVCGEVVMTTLCLTTGSIHDSWVETPEDGFVRGYWEAL